jgi:hypothetical protein
MEGGLLKLSSRGVWQQRYFTARVSAGTLSVVYTKRRGGDTSVGVELTSPDAVIKIETFRAQDGFEHDELKLTGPDTTSRAQSAGGRRELRTLRLRYNFAVARVEESVRSWYELLHTCQIRVRANIAASSPVVSRREVPAAREWLASIARRPQFAWFNDGVSAAVNPKALTKKTRYCLHLATPHPDDPTTWALHLKHPRGAEYFVRLSHISGAPSIAKGARRVVTIKEMQPGTITRGHTADVESDHRYAFETSDDAASFAFALGGVLDFLDHWGEVDSVVKQSMAEHYDVLSAKERVLRAARADAPSGDLAQCGAASTTKLSVKRRVSFTCSEPAAPDAPAAPAAPERVEPQSAAPRRRLSALRVAMFLGAFLALAAAAALALPGIDGMPLGARFVDSLASRVQASAVGVGSAASAWAALAAAPLEAVVPANVAAQAAASPAAVNAAARAAASAGAAALALVLGSLLAR